MPSPNRRLLLWLPRMQVHLPGVDAVTGLVVILVLVHLFLERAGGVMEVPWYYMDFGLSWHGFSDGKIWQLATYGLLHGDWFHLLINLLMLWLVGGRVIHILGHWKCLQIICYGVLGGGVMHLLTGLMMRSGYNESQLVGISGACLALLLTLTTLSPDSRMWPLPISGKTLGLGLIFAELFLWLMQPGLGVPVFSKMGDQMTLWGGAGLFQISHGCHLGGAVAGWWVARKLLTAPPSLEKLRQMRSEREKDIGKLGDLG
jgi:membrane associated rhomboid family serine protease